MNLHIYIDYVSKVVILLLTSLLLTYCKSMPKDNSNLNNPNVLHLDFDNLKSNINVYGKLDKVDGVREKGVYMNGKTYIHLKPLAINYPVTISTWFKGKGRILSNLLQCSHNPTWSLKIHEKSITVNYENHKSKSRKRLNFPVQINTEDWNFLNVVLKNNRKILIYINNQLIETISVEEYLGENNELILGGDNCTIIENNFSDTFNGAIDEFKIYYNNALDIESIRSNYLTEPSNIRKIKLGEKSNVDFDFVKNNSKDITWKFQNLNKYCTHIVLKSDDKTLDTFEINPFVDEYFYNDLFDSNNDYELITKDKKGNTLENFNISRKFKPISRNNIILEDAEGFGLTGMYGKDGTIYKVTNLNDSGKGSLRYGLEKLLHPRIIIFEASGSIRLRSDIIIKSPYISILGQTSPSSGIHLLDAGLQIKTHDVLIQHISIRPTDSDYSNTNYSVRDAILILGTEKMFTKKHTYNILIDHCSVSWAIDENISTWYNGVSDVTISNCIIAEALNNSKHTKGKHSKGMLIGPGSKNIAVINNIFFKNVDRNPLISGNSDVIVSNNLISNATSKIKLNDDHKKGKINSIINKNIIISDKDPSRSEVELNSKENHNIEIRGKHKIGGKVIKRSKSKQWLEKYTLSKDKTTFESKEELENYLINNAGANPNHRSETDKRLIKEIKSKQIFEYVDCVYCGNHKSIQQIEIENIKTKYKAFDTNKINTRDDIHKQIINDNRINKH